MNGIHRRIADLVETGREFAVATVVSTGGSSPRETGAKMLILPDRKTAGSVGGGKLEKMVTEDALAALAQGKSTLKHYKLSPEEDGGIGTACGGSTDILIEVHKASRTLVICGGGHVGQALAHAAAQAGMPVTVIDQRGEFSDPERFPAGTRAINISPDGEEAASLVRENSYVVILTHEHELDLAALRNLLPRRPAYIGMIGSRRKVKTALAKLKVEGFGEEELAQVHTPIGIDIGAETPAEIAVSILAEIIHHYRSGGKGGTSPESMREKLDA